MLRYGEFNHIVDDKIIETAMFIDVSFNDAGRLILSPQTGAHLVQPGPCT